MPYVIPARGLTLAMIAAIAAVVVIGLWVIGAASGADHRDSPAAEANAPLDITDVYAFRSPANNDNLVVGFGVNGLTTPDKNASTNFNADATYTLHVSNDSDLDDEATVNVDFDASTPQKFSITGLGATPITGEVTPAGQAPKITDAGGIKAFAGLRDDPFFFDLVAFKKFVAGPYVPAMGLRGPADGAPADSFAGTNVSYVIIELPVTAVTGAGASNTGTIQAWVSTSTGGGQLDRMAIPAVNTAVIPSAQKDNFNRGNPSTDIATFGATATTTIQGLRDAVNGVLNGPVGPEDGGPFGQQTAEQVSAILIPDIVTINFANPVAFPNGRQLTDDVIDVALQLVLNRTTGVTDAVSANDKTFAATFPYLAEPFVPAATAAPTPTSPAAGLPATGGEQGADDGIGTMLILAIIGAGLLISAIGAGLIVSKRDNN